MADMSTRERAEMATILAWHADPAVKAAAVQRMRVHREQDTFVRGVYAELAPGGEGWRGCFHGCLTSEALAAEAGKPVHQWIAADNADGGSYWHRHGERLWGIPRQLGAVLDSMFERVPLSYAGEFATEATAAIPVGADLSLVVARLMLDLLVHEDRGVLRYTQEGGRQRAAVEAVAALYRRKLAGETVTDDEWTTARRSADAAYADAAADADAAAAYAAAAAAAYAAAADAAAAAAYAAAAYAAAAASAYAASAYAAAYAAAAAAAARGEYYRWLAGRLIGHLAAAPVPAGAPSGG